MFYFQMQLDQEVDSSQGVLPQSPQQQRGESEIVVSVNLHKAQARGPKVEKFCTRFQNLQILMKILYERF